MIIASWNVCGYEVKAFDILNFITQNNIHTLLLQETHLTTDITSATISDYNNNKYKYTDLLLTKITKTLLNKHLYSIFIGKSSASGGLGIISKSQIQIKEINESASLLYVNIEGLDIVNIY